MSIKYLEKELQWVNITKMHLLGFKHLCYHWYMSHPEVFLCALEREWGMKANKGETEIQTCGSLLLKSPQIHLKDIWCTITTCAGTDGKHHSDLMAEDAFYSVIKHFCSSAPLLLQRWPGLQRWTGENSGRHEPREKGMWSLKKCC